MNNTLFHTIILLLCCQSAVIRSSESISSQENFLLTTKKQFVDKLAHQTAETGIVKELIQACLKGTVEQIGDLFERGADLSAPFMSTKKEDSEPFRPAHVAALAGNLPVLKEFIKRGFPVTDPRLLEAALCFGDIQGAEYLFSEAVKQKKSLTIPSVDVVLRGYLDLVRNVAQFSPEEEKLANSENCLASSGYFDCIDLLMRKGSLVNPCDPSTGTPLIFEIVSSGAWPFLKKFLQLGVDPNILNERGDTLLHAALETGNEEPIRILLNAGADPHRKNRSGLTPLELLLRDSQTQEEDITGTPNPHIYRLAVESPLRILECLAALLNEGADFRFAQKNNRIDRRKRLLQLMWFIAAPWREDKKQISLQILKALCKISYVLFLPTHAEVETARKELLHIIWCFNQLDDDTKCYSDPYTGLKMPYQKRDFIMSHSSLRNQLIKLYLVRLRNTNPHGEHFFAGIEKEAAHYLYDHVYELYFSEDPDQPSQFSTSLTQQEFRDFALEHIQEALRVRSQALKERKNYIPKVL